MKIDLQEPSFEEYLWPTIVFYRFIFHFSQACFNKLDVLAKIVREILKQLETLLKKTFDVFLNRKFNKFVK